MDETRLCLIRHGETAWNAERRIQGQLDPPLNALGIAQSRAVAGSLANEPFAALYASDLDRARHTAELIAHVLRLPLKLEPDLRERDYGLFQTLTYDEARVRHPAEFARFEAREIEFDFHGGETLDRFSARVLGCVERIAAAHPASQVLVVTHGGVLDIVHRRAAGRPLTSPRDFEIPNAALNWVEVSGERWTITAWARRVHLDPARDELP